jgi:acyl-CoA synthetase (AMP-forming)/AMP-acid ligase II
MLSHAAMVAATLLAAGEMQWPSMPRFLVTTPISHAGGTLVPTVLLLGGTVVLREGFDASTFLDTIRSGRIDSTFVVPTMLGRLLDELDGARADVPSLEQMLYGGAPISLERQLAALQAFGPVLVQSYGQAEAPNTIAVLKREEHLADRPDLLRSCGLPYASVRVTIRDALDGEVADGEAGEVCVRGPQLMTGYLGLPEETALALRGGWLRTGDVGFLGPEGHLTLVGRSRDVIVTGGFNVYPNDIEVVLQAHPAVAECVVVGVPDDTWGEAVVAVVVRRNASATAEELTALVRERKGPMHAPKRIEFVDALPVTELGKPDRQRVRGRFWEGADRQIH